MKMHRRTSVGLKLLMLFVAACTFLISSVSALAQQTERDSILNNGVSHVASWAYYTDPSSARWYISQITAGKIDVYSLGPIVNHNAGWWTVGIGAATVGLSDITISVDSNLDWNPSDTFYDIGLQKWLSDSRIHSDRQRIQGTHVPIKWFFFNPPNGSWYIVNAPGYGATTQILRFSELNGQYDWKPTDTADFVPGFSNSSNGEINVSFSTDGALKSFQWPIPIPAGATIDSPASSIYVYGAGFEYLEPTANYYVKCGNPSVYEPNADVNFHPGTDINVLGAVGGNGDMGTPIFSIADGTVRDIYLGDGSIVIEHPVGDGSSVWANYRHNSDISVSIGSTVVKGQPIAKMSNVINAGTIYAHLHFEIRKPAHPERASASSWCVYGGKSDTELNNWLYEPLTFLRAHK